MNPIATAPEKDLIASLSRAIDEVLDPLLGHTQACALLGSPNHANVGDSAIWLEGTTSIRRIGPPVGYMCDSFTYSPQELRARVNEGTILLHGGGNLGDVWPAHQRFCEEIIVAFPDRKVVQLPQTNHFMKGDNLEQARAIFNQHPDLTILVRDKRSLEPAQNEFRARTTLCPDMAFALGPLSRPEVPTHGIVWLMRTDRESAGYGVPPISRTAQPIDRVRDYPSLTFRVINRLVYETSSRGNVLRRLPALLCRASGTFGIYQGLVRRNLLRGCSALSQRCVVITHRLHGHILSLLMGIPHVTLNDKYGKLREFYDTWTKSNELPKWASTPEEALEQARIQVG
jgi:pyruvyl transferase EpsO